MLEEKVGGGEGGESGDLMQNAVVKKKNEQTEVRSEKKVLVISRINSKRWGE